MLISQNGITWVKNINNISEIKKLHINSQKLK